MKIRSKAVIGTHSISFSAAGTSAPSQYWGPAPTAASCRRSVFTAHRGATEENGNVKSDQELQSLCVSSPQEGIFFTSNFECFDTDYQSLKYSTGTGNNLYASPTFRVME